MTNFLRITFIASLLMHQLFIYAQNTGINRKNYGIGILRTENKFTIDGELAEPDWMNSEVATGFRRVLPIDTGIANTRTEVRLLYDRSNLYVGIVCFDSLPGRRPVESLRKDFNFGRNDNFLLFIDPYNDYTTGFSFGVSAAGAEWDGIQANGGTVLLDWDTKWRSAVKNYPDRWTAEFMIPFNSIRFPEGSHEWGINFSRLDLKSNEKSSWAPMPRQFATANLAFTGTLKWDEPLTGSGPRLSLIPYASGKITRDNFDGQHTKYSGTAGMDAKVLLSTSMNLDLTVNPDFSQVEVDRQQTNLDRFELFFPEKRQFFLENSDLFASLGGDQNKPFFSRRIGLDRPIIGGARLSGKIGNDWRIGLMNMQTSNKGILPGENFGIAALQRTVFSRSSVTGFFINKELIEKPEDSLNLYKFNRVTGLEYNLASADNRWTGKAYYHQSIYPGMKGNSAAVAGVLLYSTRFFSAGIGQEWTGSNYRAETGYVRRTGIYQLNPMVQYKFYPAEGSRIINHGPSVEVGMIFDNNYRLTDREIELRYNIEFSNTSTLFMEVEPSYIRLLEPFDPTNTEGAMFDAGEETSWTEFALTFRFDPRRTFNFEAGSRYGSGYFGGDHLNIEGQVNYRLQPYGNFSLAGSYDHISLPAPYNSVDLILLGPKLDFTFTNKLFLSALVQYNNQIDNVNTNIRFQWRYAPVSDLFIVYTDNSFTDPFMSKNRGIAVKLSYWFN